MNVFYLDHDPVKAAQMHNDKHCVKMVTETAQILCSALRHRDWDEDWMYRMTHMNHPCTLWAIDWNNFHWLCKLGLALSEEYTFRYGKVHKSQEIIEQCYQVVLDSHYLWGDHEPPALAMPDEYKDDDPVVAYRNYYLGDKQFYLYKNRKTGEYEKKRFMWNKTRPAPEWWVEEELELELV
jgi:hypothetical protein